MTAIAATTSTLATAAHGGPWDGGGSPFPFFLVPLFWLLVIATFVTVAVLGRRRREASSGRRAGERVLAERYADGAITEEEFRARRAVLREK